MSMGGGSSSTSDAVVQYTDPAAAMQAGYIGANAAQEAEKYATIQLNSAMNSINQGYVSASQAIQPYTQEGVQALDQLNQYIGLSPYNPGNAPTAPTAPPVYTMDQIRQANYDPNRTASENDAVSRQAANDQNQAQQEYQQQLPAYNQQKTQWDYANQLNQQYTAQGPLTQAQVSNNIENQPGYQSQLQQGIDAITRSSAGTGQLASGNMLKSLVNYGQNTFSQYYQNTLGQLAGIASAGQQAANTQVGAAASSSNSLSALYSSLGDAQANSQLEQGNSLAQALIAANQEFKTIQTGSSSSSGGGIGSILGGIGSIASAFSSKQLKEGFETINTSDILDKVNQLDIERWKYKGINTKHLGAYAEQFKELFDVGDGKTINLIDVCGVLLGSVKALSEKIDRLTLNEVK